MGNYVIMFRIPLSGDDEFLILSPNWSTLEPGWQIGLAVLLLLVPVVLVLWLYTYELRLVRRGAALALLGLRLLLLLLLWAVVAWKPEVVQERTEELPSRILLAVDRSGSMDVADPQRKILEKLRLARALKMADAPQVLDRWIDHFEKKKAAAEPPWLAEAELADAVQRGRLKKQRRALFAGLLQQVDALTRAEISRKILAGDGADLLSLLKKRHHVEILGFHHNAWDSDRLSLLFDQRDKAPTPERNTDLRGPLVKALERARKDQGPLLGILLLTDGRHTVGHRTEDAPEALAEQLAQQRVPIFPVALGTAPPPRDAGQEPSAAPADVAVLDVKVPGNVFKDVDVPIDVKVRVQGLPAQEIVVELHRPAKPLKEEHVHKIKHDGADRIYTIPFQVRLDEIGTHLLEVKARPADGKTREATTANNVLPVAVRVVYDKVRILLVDGVVRWEYHYLATALMRDQAMAVDRVVFEQPRLGLVPEDKLEKLGNPRRRLPDVKDGEDPLGKYDCIILGDVLPEHLPPADRQRLEKYVAKRGGTLVLIAGKRAMPMEFVKDDKDPFAKLVPVRDPRVVKKDEGFGVTLTLDGQRAPFLQLEISRQASEQRWAELPPHYWAVVGRAKPGAEPLAYLPHDNKPPPDAKEPPERHQGLIVHQNYPLGRVLFVGLDSTWRWRYRVGDTYHHRFWSQVIRWAAADKLLPAGNRHVRYGSREPVYRPGQDGEIAVRLSEDVPLLAAKAAANVRILREGKSDPVAVLALDRKENYPRLLEARLRDLPPGTLPPGTYRLELDIPDLKNQIDAPPDPDDPAAKIPRRDAFTILPPEDKELRDLTTDWEMLKSLAAKTKGQVYTPETVHELVDRLAAQVRPVDKSTRLSLWQDPPLVWWMFGVFLALLTVEWVGRKLAGLP